MGKIYAFTKNKKIIVLDFKNFINIFINENKIELNEKDKIFLLENILNLLFKTTIDEIFNENLYSDFLFKIEIILNSKIDLVDKLLLDIENYINGFIKDKYNICNVILVRKYLYMFLVERKVWKKLN